MYGLSEEDIDLSKLQASIIKSEGSGPIRNGRLFPYKDTVGKETIGYGRNLTDRGISIEEAKYLLANDIRDVLEQAQREVWWDHVKDNGPRWRACVEILFNVGLGSFRGFKNAITCLCNDDFSGAAREFLDSRWSDQVGQRAVILTNMIKNGSD